MDQITPAQHTGHAIDAKSSKECLDEIHAAQFFEIVKQRLKDVNSWQAMTGDALAKFTLVDSQGDDVHRPPLKGDHLKIDIPGPGGREGKGYDWVRIEAIDSQSDDESETYGFIVRPSPNPGTPTNEIAHFYSDESTSTFIVKRNGRTVTAEIHDRNTKPNDAVEKTADRIRNAVVGKMGTVAFSKIQWQQLADSLIAD
jgi:hypothetical protein